MLEHAALLIHAWTHKPLPDGPAWVRPITDSTGFPLGFLRFDGEPNASWFAWLRKVRLDVFETDDASHLMTLTRRWGILSSWDVEDADLRYVGTVYPKTLVSSENQHLGYIDRENGRILDPMGRVLARFGKKAAGVVEIAFMPEGSSNPFLRMMMLGSVLTLEPAPKVI
jgi:hypothetical protein